ncbi:hypothetical protein TNCV_2835011 [Trichonephila clavipes]|nr:hypothetical protein TNCV_2835011 [Trichonephila clavipes]
MFGTGLHDGTCDVLNPFTFECLEDHHINRQFSPDNARSVAFSPRASSLRLIEDKTFNNSNDIYNLIDYEHGQKGSDSLRADPIYAGIQLSN